MKELTYKVNEVLKALFDEAGMDRLRAKSERLTGYLAWLLDRLPGDAVDVITPREPSARGCQLSKLLLGVLDGLQNHAAYRRQLMAGAE